MRVNSKVVGSTLYVGIAGELDEHSSEYTRIELEKTFTGNVMRRVVIDLSELSFMDSTGIGVLIGRFKRLKGREIPVFLTNPTKQVDKILTISGIYNIMPKIS